MSFDETQEVAQQKPPFNFGSMLENDDNIEVSSELEKQVKLEAETGSEKNPLPEASPIEEKKDNSPEASPIEEKKDNSPN